MVTRISVESRYTVELKKIINTINKEIARRLEFIKREVTRKDAAIEESVFDQLARDMLIFLQTLDIQGTVELAGASIQEVNRKKYGRGVWEKLKINAVPYDMEQDFVNKWVSNNVSLITKTTSREVSQLETIFREAAFTGTRAKDLEAAISKVFNGGRKNVALIAIDQVGKLGSVLDEFKQTSAGIQGYYWRCSRDEDVRLLHALREGMYFSWNDPPHETPDDGHAGRPIRCRCDSEPAIDRTIGNREGIEEVEKYNEQTHKKAMEKSLAAQAWLKKKGRSK